MNLLCVQPHELFYLAQWLLRYLLDMEALVIVPCNVNIY